MNKQQYLAQATPVVTAENAAKIAAVVAAGFKVKDEHDGSGKRMHQLAGVCVYQRKDRQEVVALFDRSFSDYYCINRIEVREDGPAVTRDNCAGIIQNASHDPRADLEAIIDDINWKVVEEYPSLAPGQYFNVVLKSDI